MIHHNPPENFSGKEFRHLKVLIAEDNEVNQLLAKSILHFWGLEAKTATTGFEVMDLIENEDFDMVLMDIQMPEKSGIEAAREIRKLEDPKKRNIPIIALTANAVKGEEKKYIAVGMDDFLTKPFKEDDLYAVIERVLKNEGSFKRHQAARGESDEHENESETAVYDLSHLKDIFDNDLALTTNLVKIFIDTVPVSTREMLDQLETKNWEEVSRLAHKIKPTLDSMHMNCIKRDIRTIELNARQRIELEDIPALCKKVAKTVDKAVKQLQQEFSL